MCIHIPAEAEDLSPFWDVAMNPAEKGQTRAGIPLGTLGSLHFAERSGCLCAHCTEKRWDSVFRHTWHRGKGHSSPHNRKLRISSLTNRSHDIRRGLDLAELGA